MTSDRLEGGQVMCVYYFSLKPACVADLPCVNGVVNPLNMGIIFNTRFESSLKSVTVIK